MRYTLAVSPEPWRGFSGEGAVLEHLATDEAAGDADVVGMLLNFEPTVEMGLLADRSGLTVERVRAALTQLGTAGRVGYDLHEAAHFHRELPYERDQVAQLNPGSPPPARWPTPARSGSTATRPRSPPPAASGGWRSSRGPAPASGGSTTAAHAARANTCSPPGSPPA